MLRHIEPSVVLSMFPCHSLLPVFSSPHPAAHCKAAARHSSSHPAAAAAGGTAACRQLRLLSSACARPASSAALGTAGCRRPPCGSRCTSSDCLGKMPTASMQWEPLKGMELPSCTPSASSIVSRWTAGCHHSCWLQLLRPGNGALTLCKKVWWHSGLAPLTMQSMRTGASDRLALSCGISSGAPLPWHTRSAEDAGRRRRRPVGHAAGAAARLLSRFLLLATARSRTLFFSIRNSTAARCRGAIRCEVCDRWGEEGRCRGGGWLAVRGRPAGTIFQAGYWHTGSGRLACRLPTPAAAARRLPRCWACWRAPPLPPPAAPAAAAHRWRRRSPAPPAPPAGTLQ